MIYDFKAFDPRSRLKFDIQLKEDKRVYCLIGENGTGKTQLLVRHKKPWDGFIEKGESHAYYLTLTGELCSPVQRIIAVLS